MRQSFNDIATGTLLWPEPVRPPEPSPNAGHRDRLRERARKGGLGALPDYELLELFLVNGWLLVGPEDGGRQLLIGQWHAYRRQT